MDLLHIGLYTGTFLELIITNYILLIIFRCTLTERYRTIITLSILTALNAVQLYIQQFAKSPAQMYLLYAALMFGIAVFLFHGKWQNRVMAVVLYTITSFMAEIVGLQILLGMGYGFEKVAGPVSKFLYTHHRSPGKSVSGSYHCKCTEVAEIYYESRKSAANTVDLRIAICCGISLQWSVHVI